MKQRIITVITVIVTVVALLYWLATLFSPGSYVNTPKYEFNISEQQFLEALDKEIEANPNLKVPTYLQSSAGKNGHWYFFNIYYQQSGEIAHCWVRNDISIPSKCTVALVSIGSHSRYWHALEDYNRSQKKKQLKRFEEVLLDKIAARTNSEYDD
jgi:predicted PurR-regulated permease PerM